MRRLVLILGLAVAGWLGRRQLRSGADAQRYLTLLALLQIVAVMGKVSASPKAQAVEKRLNEVVIPALAGTAPIVTSGNASFLATLQGASDPIAAGSLGLSFTGPGGTQSVANLYSYLNGGFATLMGNLLAYTDALGTCVNSIISSGSTAGIWP